MTLQPELVVVVFYNLLESIQISRLSLFAIQPFHQPLPLDDYWIVLLLPMVLAISAVYKAIKTEDLSQLPRQAVSLAFQIIAFMILAAAMLWLVTELI